MPLPSTVELVCSFSTVKTEPLSPFVWLLLKTIRTFPEGSRPDFEQLAEKMAFKDHEYLHQAWADVTSFNLCRQSAEQAAAVLEHSDVFHRKRIDFQTAVITQSGTRALEDGFIALNQPRERKGEALYFTLRDGSPITKWKAHYESKEIGSLHRPAWADEITERTISNTLKFQRESEDEHIQPDEQIFDLIIHWEERRRVKLD